MLLHFFSASTVELKLLTKEQRITNKIVSLIFFNIMLSILTGLIVAVLVEYEIILAQFYQIVFKVLFSISTVHGLFAYIVKESPSLNSIRNNKIFRVISAILVIITFPYLSLLIAPIAAETITMDQQTGMNFKIFFTTFVFANICTPLYIIYFIVINKMMVLEKFYYIELPVTISDSTANPSRTEKWYLIHPINKDHYLLAENSEVAQVKKSKAYC